MSKKIIALTDSDYRVVGGRFAVRAYLADGTMVFDEQYEVDAEPYEVLIQAEAGIDRIEFLTPGGEVVIDDICISH